MNPYRAYQQRASSAWLRIDMILALYDGLIGKLEAARAALTRKDAREVRKLLDKSRLMLGGLVSGVDPSRGELATEFLRLYEFVNHSLTVADLKHLDAALKVLRTLREGLEAIRPEAAELERSGRIPPAGAVQGVQVVV
jgi:flagellar biosynthetic protein FliS